MEFNSALELYERVTPALRSKSKEFKRNKIDYIKEEDIWNYLVDNIWKNSTGLDLFHIVDDILNTDNRKIELYVQNKFKNTKRDINYDDNLVN